MAAKNIDIPDRFDPRETTLEEFITKYKSVKGAGKTYGQLFSSRPELQPLLKRPVIEILSQDMISDPNSPLNRGIDNATSESMKNTLRGYLRGIERNVFRMMDQLAIPREGYITPSTQIVVAAGTGTAKKTDKVAFNPELIGKWYVEAEKYIAANPSKAPAVLAFMYALQTGFRPDEVLQTNANHIVKPRNPGDRVGVFMTPKNMQKKTGNVMNAPLSSHASGILAMQTQLNAGLTGDTPFVFMMVDEKTGKTRRVTTADVNAAIREIKVPGILIDITGATPVDKDTFDEMYDARRMNATLYSHIDVDEVRAGMLKGRDVKQAGSGRESTYIGPAPGVYKKGSLEDTEKFAAFIQNSYEKAGGRYIQGVDDTTVSSFNKIGLDTTQETHTLRLSRPPEIVVEDDSKKPVGAGPTEGVTDVDVAKNIAKDGGSNVLNKWRSRGKNLGKLGLGVLGTEGIIQSYQKGYQEATGAGAGPGMAAAAGVGVAAYENVLEPVPVSFLRAQEAGMAGVSDVPADVEGLGPQETDFTRKIEIEKMDARNATIEEQMNRIKAYDEAMANKETEGEIKADIEIVYPTGE